MYDSGVSCRDAYGNCNCKWHREPYSQHYLNRLKHNPPGYKFF